MKGPEAVDNYIATFPQETQVKLQEIRQLIKLAAPEAQEVIGYNMPAFTLHGALVYYAAYKNHIGFYAIPTAHRHFANELSAYKQGKGSVQFPLDQPLPRDLIIRMVEFRVKENLQMHKIKNP